MRNRALLFSMALVVTLLGVSWAGQTETRWATGRVVATDTRALPNTIVVSAKNWKGEKTIIGAAVVTDTVIKLGKSPATLADVRPGDMVDIVYERNKRVVARSIKIRR